MPKTAAQELDSTFKPESVLQVIHSNDESLCSRHESTGKNADRKHEWTDHAAQQMCGHVKRWVVDTGKNLFKGHGVGAHMHGEGGHWVHGA